MTLASFVPDFFILTLWLVLIRINIFRNAFTVLRSRNQPARKLTQLSLAHPLWSQRNFLVIFCNLKLYFLDHTLQETNSSGVLGGREIKDLVNRNKPILRYRCFLIKSPDPLFHRHSFYHIHFHFWNQIPLILPKINWLMLHELLVYTFTVYTYLVYSHWLTMVAVSDCTTLYISTEQHCTPLFVNVPIILKDNFFIYYFTFSFQLYIDTS